MGNYFGTDGVRGEYGKDITDELAKKLGYYGTKVLTDSHKPTIIIGTDTRESAHNLENALAEGISQAEGKVLLAGVIPTPAVALLVRELGADAGIVVSASHNPYYDNGIKFFNNDGFKLPDQVEEKIEEELVTNGAVLTDSLTNTEKLTDADEIYLHNLLKYDHPSLEGKKIVLDCANGAASNVAPEYFRRLGADVIVINNEPNGKNINDECGSTELKQLLKTVKEEKADFGFAFDGDADRCKIADENGNEIDGDGILYLLAKKFREEGKLNDDTVVITIMSNLGLHQIFEREGYNKVVTDVGDRYVLEEMLKNNYSLGGEQSGHVIVLDRNSTGDGLQTASLMADLFVESDMKPSELNAQIKRYPQIQKDVKVSNEKKELYKEDKEIQDKIKAIEEHLGDKGRILVRPSGTEPLVRVMIEGLDKKEIEQLTDECVELINKNIVNK